MINRYTILAVILIVLGTVLLADPPKSECKENFVEKGFLHDGDATYRTRILQLEAALMFEKLKRQGGTLGKMTTLKFVHDDQTVNAYVNQFGEVHMYTGMLLFNEGFPEHTAAVLAHEIAHFTMGHTTYNYSKCRGPLENSRACEKEADLVGLVYMKKAGYNHCEAAGIWLRIFLKYGPGSGTSHPRHMERFEYLRCKG